MHIYYKIRNSSHLTKDVRTVMYVDKEIQLS